MVVEPVAPGARFARVNPAWKGETAVVIGTGPSLTPDQVERCRGLHCIAVSDSYRLAPWAEVCYFADDKWWKWHREKLEFKAFAGIKASIENSMGGIGHGALFLRNAGTKGSSQALSDDPCYIGTGSNSGFQALNIALLAGASRVILIGLDGKSSNGKKHWFGDHPDKTEPPYQAMKSAFKIAADECKRRGVEVLNCAPGSALDHFRMVSLDEALCLAPTA